MWQSAPCFLCLPRRAELRSVAVLRELPSSPALETCRWQRGAGVARDRGALSAGAGAVRERSPLRMPGKAPPVPFPAPGRGIWSSAQQLGSAPAWQGWRGRPEPLVPSLQPGRAPPAAALPGSWESGSRRATKPALHGWKAG